MESTFQETLPIFEPDTFNELLSSRKVNNLSISVSERMRRSWYVKINTHSDTRILTIPSYLENAPNDIKIALIDWALLPNPRTRHQQKLISGLKLPLEQKIQSYIKTFHSSRLHISFNPEKKCNGTAGVKFNLQDIFDSVNLEYFNNRLHAFLRWGKPGTTTSYQTTRNLVNGEKCNLITIAGVYNHPDVPRYAIEAVMFHEIGRAHV